MKILLVSDTHGNLNELEELIQKTHVDAVIHAGDFGFYDSESVHRLQTRELFLLLVHSPFQKEYAVSREMPRERLIEIIQEKRLLGDFPDYLAGKKKFSVPIYAVWGNHEDLVVVEALRKKHSVHNLFLLDENHFYQLEGLRIFGIGGNWLPQKLFDPPLAGKGGKLWASLSQFGSLYQKLKEETGPAVFVSHVSPGKEPLLVRLMSQFKYDLWISGHMGAPYPCLWNGFTVRNPHEELAWLSPSLEVPSTELSEDTRLALDLLQKPPLNRDPLSDPWFLNLPDIGDGHALLTLDEGRLSLATFGKGKRVGF